MYRKESFKITAMVFATITLLATCYQAAASNKNMAKLSAFNQTLPVQTSWEKKVGSGADEEYLKLTPAIVDGSVYVVDYKGRITALNTVNGQKIWSIRVKEKLTSGVGADNEALFVGTKSAEVMALDAKNGNVLWRTPVLNEVLGAPFVYRDTVLVKTLDGHLYALNKQNGKVVWTVGEPNTGLALRSSNSPQVVNGKVVVGFSDGQLGVFNVKNGELLWKQAIAQPRGMSVVDQMVDISDSLAVTDSMVYVATYQGVLSALALNSGQLKWQHEISSYAGLAVDRNNVYITDEQSYIWAFNRQTGALLWKQDQLHGRSLTGPAVVANVLVVGDSKGYIHWLSTTDGSFVARTQLGKKGILSTPLVHGTDVYIYSNTGQLAKYNI